MDTKNLTTEHLTLYHYRSCPFCARVNMLINELELDIESRDILRNPEFRQELIAQGGKAQVPCLRIEHPGMETVWLYESLDIIRFLRAFDGDRLTA